MGENLAKCVISGAIIAATASIASAVPIVSYDLTGSTQASAPATTVAEGIVAGEVFIGPGPNLAGLANGLSANAWSNPEIDGRTGSRVDALTAGDFFEFSFEVAEGYIASLSTIETSLRRSGLTAAQNFEWQYSFDGFTTPGNTIAAFKYLGRASGTGNPDTPTVASNFNYMTTDVADQGAGNPTPAFALSQIGDLQDISDTTVTFRLYGWGATSSSATVALGRVNGPMIGGTITVIPEPASLALLGIGLLGLGRRRHS